MPTQGPFADETTVSGRGSLVVRVCESGLWLINYELWIDLGSDVMTASMMHNLSLAEGCYWLQTRAPADHLDTSDSLSRRPAYGVLDAPRLRFYASHGTLRAAVGLLE